MEIELKQSAFRSMSSLIETEFQITRNNQNLIAIKVYSEDPYFKFAWGRLNLNTNGRPGINETKCYTREHLKLKNIKWGFHCIL
jgi:hypothetical protein